MTGKQDSEPGGIRRALVVEDDARMSHLETRILEMEGYVVTCVDNGLAALGELQVTEADVIILDLAMPYFEGEKFFRELQDLYPALAKRVVFVTGMGDDREVREMVERTGQPLVGKPFELSEFKRAVRSLGARTENHEHTPVPPPASLAREADAELANVLLSGLDATANAVVITTAEGRIEWVNPAFTRLTGYSADEVIGGTPRLLKSGKMDDEFYQDLWETVLAGKVWRGEIINKRKDGTLYHEEMTIAPVKNADGEVTHHIAVKQDGTARILAREALEQAKKRAEESVLLKTSFLSNMSHEVRTPLNGVLGITNLLLDGEDDPDRQHQLELVRTCAEDLLKLLNDILDFSRLQAGQVDLVRTPVDLRSVVESAVELWSAKAFDRAVLIRWEVAEDIPQVVICDKIRLGQVLRNLIDNAVKFTEKGEVAVVVSVTKMGDGYADIRITVRDTGIGIPKEELGKIWSEFVQVDSSTTRKYGGTGLGLTITKKLIDQMGGAISVESELGKGSQFTVDLRFGLPGPDAGSNS